MPSSPTLASQLHTRALLLMLLLGSLTTSGYYLQGRHDIAVRLASLHTLIEQRFVDVLAQSVWDVDTRSTQQLLQSINHLDGVERVELNTTQGWRQSSQLEPGIHSEWLRDFPVQSERAGSQPVATLRLYLDRERQLGHLLRVSLLQGALVMLGMLAMWLLCWRQIRQHVLQPLQHISQQADRPDNGHHVAELQQLQEALQHTARDTQRQQEHMRREYDTLQQQREQLAELLARRSSELDQLARAQQQVLRIVSRLAIAHHRPPDEREQTLHDALAGCGRLLGASSCHLAWRNEHGTWQGHIQWHSRHSDSSGYFERYPPAASAWLLPQLAARQQLAISRLQDIPPEGYGERLQLAEAGIHSLLLTRLRGGTDGFISCELQQHPRDWRDSELGHLQLLASLLGQILSQQQLQQQLHDSQQQCDAANLALQAHSGQDGLTGLANADRQQQRLAELFGQAFVQQQPFSIVLADIDRFGAYNLQAGHRSGDQCLQHVANCLRQQLPAHDALAARISADRFMLLLPRYPADQALQCGQQLCAAVMALQIPHPQGGQITLSAGTATLSLARHDDAAALHHEAERALQQAIQAGGNRACQAEPT